MKHRRPWKKITWINFYQIVMYQENFPNTALPWKYWWIWMQVFLKTSQKWLIEISNSDSSAPEMQQEKEVLEGFNFSVFIIGSLWSSCLGTNILKVDLKSQNKLTKPKTSHRLASINHWRASETHNTISSSLKDNWCYRPWLLKYRCWYFWSPFRLLNLVLPFNPFIWELPVLREIWKTSGLGEP